MLQHQEPAAILNCSCQQPLWDSDAYMKPVLEDDPLLQFGWCLLQSLLHLRRSVIHWQAGPARKTWV